MDGWGLRRAVSLPFAGPAAISSDPDHLARLHTYTSDMVRPFGLRSERAAAGRGQSYGEMAREALGELLSEGETADLLMLAYGIPDVEPGRATTTYLSHVCPGNPLAFALSDQGTAAAFTGLRLAHEYARTGEARRTVLLIAEQAELPYPPAEAVSLPTGHAIVALLFAGNALNSPLGRIERVVIQPGVPPDGVTAHLRHFIGDDEKPTILLGSALDASTVEGAYAAPPGRPGTGVWTLLAEELSGNLSGTVIVADYDPQLRYFSAATFRFA